jgi:glycerol-3-phosphate O-acyltransferase/dihydroxyacetone phosphate acyltransferase
MQDMIASGTIDSPSWDLVRIAKTATRIYAPLGTAMSLGDYVRVMKVFTEAFKEKEDTSEDSDEGASAPPNDRARHKLRQDLKVFDIH